MEDEPEPEEKPIKPRDSSYLAPAKGKNFETSDRKKARTAAFEKPTGPNRFDVEGWGNLRKSDSVDAKGKPLQYPEPTEPRPPAQKRTYNCDKCFRPFQAYPSEVPHAREIRMAGGDSFTPLVYCENCLGMRH